MQYAMRCAEFVVCALAFCSTLGSLLEFFFSALQVFCSLANVQMWMWMCMFNVSSSYPFQLSLLREMELLASHLHIVYPFCQRIHIRNTKRTEGKWREKKTNLFRLHVCGVWIGVLRYVLCQLLERHVTNIFLLNYSLKCIAQNERELGKTRSVMSVTINL